MKEYTYGFVWFDKHGIARKAYLYAASKAEAIIEFEKLNNMSIDLDKVTVTKVHK